MIRFITGLYHRIFIETYVSTSENARNFNTAAEGKKFDIKLVITAVTVALSLVFIEYFGKDPAYLTGFLKSISMNAAADKISYLLGSHPNHQLYNLGYWVMIIAVFYLLLPAAIIKFVFREKLRNYGLTKGSLFKDYKLYLLMFIIMIPLVIFFSRTEGFQYRYPFYRVATNEALWPNFWTWELLYLFQFFCLEFFFRGFMVHGLKQRFGYYSVFMMTIPYCMIHFGKPLPETIAAIIAGIVLGTLSLKSRTIWMGVIIHYSVAIAMDLSALWQKGYWAH